MTNIRPLRSALPSSHLSYFSQFAADLQQTIRQSVPTDYDLDFGRYHQASILSFDWNNDNTMPGVKPLRDELLQLLRTVYSFKTESYALNPNDAPETIFNDFRNRLMTFTNSHKRKSREAKHLLVYYYSGHSDAGPQGDQLRLA